MSGSRKIDCNAPQLGCVLVALRVEDEGEASATNVVHAGPSSPWHGRAVSVQVRPWTSPRSCRDSSGSPSAWFSRACHRRLAASTDGRRLADRTRRLAVEARFGAPRHAVGGSSSQKPTTSMSKAYSRRSTPDRAAGQIARPLIGRHHDHRGTLHTVRSLRPGPHLRRQGVCLTSPQNRDVRHGSRGAARPKIDVPSEGTAHSSEASVEGGRPRGRT
jgi:hypothetical protein